MKDLYPKAKLLKRVADAIREAEQKNVADPLRVVVGVFDALIQWKVFKEVNRL